MTYDVVIKGGTVVDGSGAPRVRADLAIKDGVVASIGRIPTSEAARTVDASGLVVAPGFVDLHTHYDAQLFWDPYCSLSGWHGVTSVVIGNCGFGFAPVAPELRDRAMLTMTRVEAIPYESMRQGLPWTWTTVPQYLDAVDQAPKAVNVQALVGVANTMVAAMGLERAKAGARPTDDEHRTMRQIVDEAMAAGAGGWSAQRTAPDSGFNVQRDYDGTPMVTDVMHDETMLALAEVLAEHNAGFVQVTCVKRTQQESIDMVERIAAASGRPVLYNVIQCYDGYPEGHRFYLRWLQSCRERGLPVYGQGITTDAGFTFDFRDWNLYDESDIWAEATSGTHEDKLHKLADPERRARLRKTNPYVVVVPIPKIVVLSPKRPEHEQFRSRTVGEIAQQLGKHPVDAMLDLAVAENLETVFYGASPNDGHAYMDELLADPYILCGVSDGGAHTKFTTTGRYPTEVLTHAMRDKGWLTLEQAHWRLSGLPAHLAGFADRGTLRAGQAADIAVYDPERLEVLPEEIVHDFPGGEWRRVQRARGYRHVFVNGVETICDDQPLDAYAGRLLRYGRRDR